MYWLITFVVLAFKQIKNKMGCQQFFYLKYEYNFFAQEHANK